MADGLAVSDAETVEEGGAPLTLRETQIFLGLLSAIDRNGAVSQRDLARELGIAVGWINTYLKRCVRKGLIKVSQAPLNRYAYYLTPTGFREKSRLTIEYLNCSFGFLRQARAQYRELFDQCRVAGFARVALVGGGELAEIAVLSAQENGLAIVAVVDPVAAGTSCCGVPVVAGLAMAGALQALVISDLGAPQETFERAVTEAAAVGLDEERVLVPALLNVTRGPGLAVLRAHSTGGTAADSPAEMGEGGA